MTVNLLACGLSACTKSSFGLHQTTLPEFHILKLSNVKAEGESDGEISLSHLLYITVSRSGGF